MSGSFAIFSLQLISFTCCSSDFSFSFSFLFVYFFFQFTFCILSIGIFPSVFFRNRKKNRNSLKTNTNQTQNELKQNLWKKSLFITISLSVCLSRSPCVCVCMHVCCIDPSRQSHLIPFIYFNAPNFPKACSLFCHFSYAHFSSFAHLNVCVCVCARFFHSFSPFHRRIELFCRASDVEHSLRTSTKIHLFIFK